jgi:excisionase family DNA binding protein
MTKLERMLSVEQLADLLGVKKKTVYEEYRHWGLEAYKVGRALRFPESAVITWLETRKVA